MVDLRSDTLTLPDQAMLETILTAKLGDDGRVDASGRGEDLAVNELEDLAAELTGKEAALLFPTGTMGNTCGVLTWANSGDKILVHEQQHLLLTEKFLFDDAFCRMQPIKYKFNKNETPDLQNMEELLKSSGAKLICLENTHNFSGGYCIPVEEMKKIRQLADRYGAHIHMDGARLFHAAAALNVPVREITQYVDSVMFCISKGLRAPVGSLLCGPADFIKKARENAKYCGGVMRQAGIIAAPGLVALEHGYEVACRDNKNARILGERLAAVDGCLHVDLDTVQSNMVKVRVDKPASEVMAEIKTLGIKVGSIDNSSFRLVTHADNSDEDILNAADILAKYSKEH